MLKRQRSSPSFTPAPPYAATPEPALDVYDRVAKRRRQLEPPRDRPTIQGNSAWNADDTDGEEDIDHDGQGNGLQGPLQRAGRLEEAGEYRDVNTLLHDLHAEQRHRLLFSSPLPPFHHPNLHHRSQPEHYHHPYPSSSDKTVPALSFDGSQAAPHRDNRKHAPSFTISIPIKDASAVDHVEVQRVTQRYEGTNRYLGSLFLSRRTQFDTPGHPSQA
ncbi:hypothetical protein BV20DRAFT_961530 [Pilatotrama ljubarskyi]|nr:hypothetical protein BV20DRAFT_961530 [Pilatotrama ljubarskyi]